MTVPQDDPTGDRLAGGQVRVLGTDAGPRVLLDKAAVHKDREMSENLLEDFRCLHNEVLFEAELLVIITWSLEDGHRCVV